MIMGYFKFRLNIGCASDKKKVNSFFLFSACTSLLIIYVILQKI